MKVLVEKLKKTKECEWEKLNGFYRKFKIWSDHYFQITEWKMK